MPYCGCGVESFRYLGTDLALSSYTTLLKSNMDEGSRLDGEEVLFQVMILRFYMLNFRALRTSKNFKSHWCPPCGQNVTSPEGILPGWLCPLCHIFLDFPWTHHCIAMPPVFAGTCLQIFSRCHQRLAGSPLKWPWRDLTQNDAWNVCYRGIPFKTDEWSCNVIIRELLAESEIPLTWHLRSGWIVVMRVMVGPTSP